MFFKFRYSFLLSLFNDNAEDASVWDFVFTHLTVPSIGLDHSYHPTYFCSRRKNRAAVRHCTNSTTGWMVPTVSRAEWYQLYHGLGGTNSTTGWVVFIYLYDFYWIHMMSSTALFFGQSTGAPECSVCYFVLDCSPDGILELLSVHYVILYWTVPQMVSWSPWVFCMLFCIELFPRWYPGATECSVCYFVLDCSPDGILEPLSVHYVILYWTVPQMVSWSNWVFCMLFCIGLFPRWYPGATECSVYSFEFDCPRILSLSPWVFTMFLCIGQFPG